MVLVVRSTAYNINFRTGVEIIVLMLMDQLKCIHLLQLIFGSQLNTWSAQKNTYPPIRLLRISTKLFEYGIQTEKGSTSEIRVYSGLDGQCYTESHARITALAHLPVLKLKL